MTHGMPCVNIHGTFGHYIRAFFIHGVSYQSVGAARRREREGRRRRRKGEEKGRKGKEKGKKKIEEEMGGREEEERGRGRSVAQ